MTDFFFYAHLTFENWDFSNPVTVGIGGSETSQIEMASRLAARGHKVISYAPVPYKEETVVHRDVKWLFYEKATCSEDGIWIVYRCPEVLDLFELNHPNQKIWFVAQDTFYSSMTEERAAKIDKYICLCPDHQSYVERRYPYLEGKIDISSNGISVDKIEKIEKEGKIVRNEARLVWTSSPDRGLEALIPIMKKVIEYVPEVELHCFYGFDNINKIIDKFPNSQALKKLVMDSIDNINIFWHGRQNQYQIIREFLKSGIWCYPTNFPETSCISCMEAQALGAIPIINPIWALRTNVFHGIVIEGDTYDDKLVQSMYAGEIIRLIQHPDHMAHIREGMMEDARNRFSWEVFVDQWEKWAS
jgi:glycosyltransferase involved in cell wall biosynthesis